MLTSANISDLEENGYEYILGARIKGSGKEVKKILDSTVFKNGDHIVIPDDHKASRLIVQYSDDRAKKDSHNRARGLERLEKQIKTGKLTKNNINNRGYNKYLKMEGEIKVSIDKQKYLSDAKWDGLKGYVTNSTLSDREIISNYRNLWHIEKAFRMSKTDLRIRPIYHRIKHRIEAHICLSFTAYTIYKELERVLKLENFELSPEKAAEITRNIYHIEVTLPESRKTKNIILKMDEVQNKLIEIVNRNF